MITGFDQLSVKAYKFLQFSSLSEVQYISDISVGVEQVPSISFTARSQSESSRKFGKVTKTVRIVTRLRQVKKNEDRIDIVKVK